MLDALPEDVVVAAQGFASDQERASELLDAASASMERDVLASLPPELASEILSNLQSSIANAKLAISGTNGPGALRQATQSAQAIHGQVARQVAYVRLAESFQTTAYLAAHGQHMSNLSTLSQCQVDFLAKPITIEDLQDFVSQGLLPEEDGSIPDNRAVSTAVVTDHFKNTPRGQETIVLLNETPAETKAEAVAQIQRGSDAIASMETDPELTDEYGESIHSIKKYKLYRNRDGQQLMQKIQQHDITGAEAMVLVDAALQKETHALTPLARDAARQMPTSYQAIYREESILKPDGSVDVEQLFASREKYDGVVDRYRKEHNLDWKQFAHLPDSELPPEVLRARALSTLSKSVDAMRLPEQIYQMSQEIQREKALVQDGVIPPELQQKMDRFSLITNADDRYTEEAQREALKSFYLEKTGKDAPTGWGAKRLDGILDATMMDLNTNRDKYTSATDADAVYQGFYTIYSQLKETRKTPAATSEKLADLETKLPVSTEPAAVTPTIPTTVSPTTEPTTEAPLSPVPPVPSMPVEAVPTLAMREEGSKGSWDNLYENALEDAIGKATKDQKNADVLKALEVGVGVYNVGEKTYLSTHEIENALNAAGFTRPQDIGNGDTVLTLDEIAAALTPKTTNVATGPSTNRT